MRPVQATAVSASDVPSEINAIPRVQAMGTQEAFGRIMLRLADVPKVGERVITTSADVRSPQIWVAGLTRSARLPSKKGPTTKKAAPRAELEANERTAY